MIFYHIVPPGTLLLEASDGVLIRCQFCKTAPGESFQAVSATGVIADAIAQIDEYFADTRRVFDLPLRPASTQFAADVREALAHVPYGGTISYGQLAVLTGRRGGARAVGNALGANPFHIIVPCHRIIAADGSAGGYAGGADVKQFLLQHEQNDMKIKKLPIVEIFP